MIVICHLKLPINKIIPAEIYFIKSSLIEICKVYGTFNLGFKTGWWKVQSILLPWGSKNLLIKHKICRDHANTVLTLNFACPIVMSPTSSVNIHANFREVGKDTPNGTVCYFRGIVKRKRACKLVCEEKEMRSSSMYQNVHCIFFYFMWNRNYEAIIFNTEKNVMII